jgi:hypothetical protein
MEKFKLKMIALIAGLACSSGAAARLTPTRHLLELDGYRPTMNANRYVPTSKASAFTQPWAATLTGD